ncbi:methyltransferase [Desulfopila inferna]|uniref:methyltransferase n=1 Tax=Desulfopila inferna TaxID=468528 RepID=UPI001965047C|nr:methyltransferase [Desulfopila inferna]MBM9606122.1 SAM-dependent methyltransferase [Desulfopila inferna]
MKKNWDVGKLLSVSSGYWKGCTLQAGVRLEIFSHIGGEQLTAEKIAARIGTDGRATEFLLNGLTALGLLVKEENYFSNTSFATAFLSRNSPKYMGHIILHHHHLLDGWAQLDKTVVTGGPVEQRSFGEEAERESFLMGMFNLAMELAPRIAEEVDLHGSKHLLDLGGGPGTYAIHFCLANPELQATIWDRPTTRPFAKKTVESFNLGERIFFIGGDLTADPVSGGPYDAAWLSHILHSNSEKECREIIAKTVAQMSPGGRIFIHDFILDNSKVSPEFAALFSLNMLINTSQGRSYSEEEIMAMMLDAGVSKIRRHTFSSPNDSSILFGVV